MNTKQYQKLLLFACYASSSAQIMASTPRCTTRTAAGTVVEFYSTYPDFDSLAGSSRFPAMQPTQINPVQEEASCNSYV